MSQQKIGLKSAFEIVAPKLGAEVIATIMYEGDFGKLEPEEIHFDTQHNSISVLFNNGQEKVLKTMSQEVGKTLSRLHEEFNKTKKTSPQDEMVAGLYEMDAKTSLPKVDGRSWNVTAVII